jgi:hypothetical protein
MIDTVQLSIVAMMRRFGCKIDSSSKGPQARQQYVQDN